MTIRKIWNAKVLLLVNIIFKKYREKDEHFNPAKFLEEVNLEKYFKILRTWKQDFEKSYLDENPTYVFHQSGIRSV